MAEWWWAHETVRILVCGAVLVAWCYYLVWSFFRPFIKADKEHDRRRYERENQEVIELEKAMEELNRTLAERYQSEEKALDLG